MVVLIYLNQLFYLCNPIIQEGYPNQRIKLAIWSERPPSFEWESFFLVENEEDSLSLFLLNHCLDLDSSLFNPRYHHVNK